MVNAHVTVRNNTDRSHVYFIQFSQMVTFFKAIITGHNVDTYITHWSPKFDSVYVVLYDFISYRGSCGHHHNQETHDFSHYKNLSFMPTPASPSACRSTPPLTLEITSPLSTSKMLSLQKCHTNTIIQHVLWGPGVFSPKNNSLESPPACCTYR